MKPAPVYTTTSLSADIETYIANPTRIHQYMLRLLESASNGEAIVVDPTNPFAFLLEASTAVASAAINKAESLTRRQYSTLATTYEDLYHHMSDADYLGRFASPSSTVMSLLLGLDEVRTKAVTENNAGVKLLTIPRYAKFTVAEIPFTLLYPIDIRILRHGGIRVTYNDDELLEIKTLESNIVDWHVVSIEGKEWLKIDIPLQQLDLHRNLIQVNMVTGVRKEFNITGSFYHCEAYNQVNGEWVRIRTTHSDRVYDPTIPTVCLKVLNGAVRVDIPQVYLNNKSISDAVRIDIFTTQGPLTMSLAGYNTNSFEAKWNNIPGSVISQWSAPLNAFNSISIMSVHTVEGGARELTFNELRERVITRTTSTEGLPITKHQLGARLRDLGFDLVTNIDDITDRQFIATKTLPAGQHEGSVSGMGVTVQTLFASLRRIGDFPFVLKNDDRYTILPEQLYTLDNGILNILSEHKQLEYKNITDAAVLTEQVNDHHVLYTPYYYVIDRAGNTLDTRIYDMDNPVLSSRFFFNSNLTLGAKFDILGYKIIPNETNDGYELYVQADLGATFKKFPANMLDIQMSFKGTNGNARFYVTGAAQTPVDEDGLFIGDTYVWKFDIKTRYDVNVNDELLLLPQYAPVLLTHEFDIVAVQKGWLPDSYEPSDLDSIVKESNEAGGQWIAVTQEKIIIKFGERLERLYNRTRTILDNTAVATRTTDEPMTYDVDVFEYDETGTISFAYDSATKQIVANKLHDAGDIVYDEFGNMLYRWRAGDIIKDVQGNPVYKDNGLGLTREIDMILFDAKYYFANSPIIQRYKKELVQLINKWVNVDMVALNHQLLERSEMFFHPSITKGNIKVVADNNKHIVIDTQQTFVITFFMNEIRYNDAALREAIKKTAIQTLYDGLQFTTVSKDSLINRLRAAIGDDIVSVDLEGFLRDGWRAATLSDPAHKLSFAKRLVSRANGEYSVEDAVDVKFLLHTN